MPLPLDLHTHTAAGGHGTAQTIADLAKAACKKGMTALGISDHGPATPGSCRESYFRSLRLAPRKRCGITVLYGAEANILDMTGRLDLTRETLSGLDYCIASIHEQSFQPLPQGMCLTDAYINAMENPYVKILGHVDDARYPASINMSVDMERLLTAAIEKRVILEINEASLAPDGYRGNARPNTHTVLSLCKKYRYPVLLSSDSHGAAGVGEAPSALALLRELDFPSGLVLNNQPAQAILRFRDFSSFK